MFLFAITVSALLGPALSRPQEPVASAVAPASQSESTPIPIVSQTDEINPDGSFKFSYETANGIKVEENGYLKDGNESSTDKIQVIEGSVSYTDNEGKVIHLKYIADENGFQPEGDHLPTVPPVPGATNALRALPEQSESKPADQSAAKASAQPAPQPVAPSTVQPAAQPPAPPAAQPAAQPTTEPASQPTAQPEAQLAATAQTQTP